jgi:splicing factor 3A subunit 1
VALEDVNEHQRIELLDPRWRDENARRLAKTKETAYAKPEDISRNLSGFAKNRADIFGSTVYPEYPC